MTDVWLSGVFQALNSLLQRFSAAVPVESAPMTLCEYVEVGVFTIVSGLPYPNHTQSDYTKMEGVCPDNFYSANSEEVSLSTCRYLCDTAPRKSPCNIGFTYYDITPEDARLGTTVSKCRFLIGNCAPTQQNRSAFTYFRQQMAATTKRIV